MPAKKKTLFISMSADAFVLGERVAIYCTDRKWYLGTVAKVGTAKFACRFDNGVKDIYSIIPTKYVRRVEIPQPHKEGMTAAQLKDLIPVAHAVIHQHREVEQEAITTDLTFADVFEHDTPLQTRLTFFKQEWLKANKKYFGNRLKLPDFALVKGSDAKHAGMRLMGRWIPFQRKINMADWQFRIPAGFSDTLLHEMCHQAMTELYPDAERTEGDHGATWRKLAKNCGIEPKAFATELTNTIEGLSEQQKSVIESNREYIADAVEKMKKWYKPLKDFAIGSPCMFPSNGGICAGYVFHKVVGSRGNYFCLGFLLSHSDPRKSFGNEHSTLLLSDLISGHCSKDQLFVVDSTQTFNRLMGVQKPVFQTYKRNYAKS